MEKESRTCERELYEIRVEERLDPAWVERTTGLASLYDPDGHTLLTGLMPDHEALHRILAWLHDLQFRLVSVHRVEGVQTDQGGITR